MGIPLNVLFVEDSVVDVELTTAELVRGGFEPRTRQVQTQEEMQAALESQDWDLIICDYRMPRFSAEGALATVHESGRDLPFIITSGAVTAEDTVPLLKQGAHDFMDKSSLVRLVPAVQRELREADVRRRQRESQERVRVLSRAVEQSPVSVVITDPCGQIEYVNPLFEQITGYSAEEALGRPMAFTLWDEESSHAMNELWSTVRGGREWRGEFCNVTRTGQLFWEYVNVSPLTDDDGRVTQYVVIKEDITVRRSYEEQLLRKAHYDDLTGLANRVLLMDRMKLALENASRQEHKVAILGIDLDHFKNVNDSLGHSVGDMLLTEAADRLGACVRGGDTLARTGGDEFVVILPEITDIRAIQVVANKIINQFEKPFNIIGRDYFVTASIGISLYPDDGANPHLVLRNADLAMYKAKDLGRGQYHFFTEDINERLLERLDLEAKLRYVVPKEELCLHYQPIFDFADRTVVGFEALVRWRQEDGSLRMPGEFIPMAEELGIIHQIDSWVLQAACRESAGLIKNSDRPLRLAINISPRQLEMPEYADFVERQLHENGLTPQQLELEMTERVLVVDRSTTQANLERLCALGVRMSIDDFGTGYSSLGYLQKYTFHTLKIDRSFVSNIEKNDSASRLIDTIITLAHGLGMEVIAEGIETEQEWDFLKRHDCDQAQGFMLARPDLLEGVQELLEAEREKGPRESESQ